MSCFCTHLNNSSSVTRYFDNRLSCAKLPKLLLDMDCDECVKQKVEKRCLRKQKPRIDRYSSKFEGSPVEDQETEKEGPSMTGDTEQQPGSGTVVLLIKYH